MVRTGVAADPGGEGAEVRGVPDIVDPQQGWQGEFAQGMAAIGQVREPCRQRETGATSSCTEGVDQTRLPQLVIGCLPADTVEIGEQHRRLAAGSLHGDPGDLLIGQCRLADPVPPEARRWWVRDDDGDLPIGCGDTRLQIGATGMQLEQLSLPYRVAREETLTGDTGRMQHVIWVVAAKQIGDGGALLRSQLLQPDDIGAGLAQYLDQPQRSGQPGA